MHPGSAEAFGQAFTTTGTPLWDDSELPTFLTVRDAAADQGGFVRTTWTPGIADHPAARAVSGYRVWRALPSGSITSLAGMRPSGDGMFRLGGRTLLAFASAHWELADAPAAPRRRGGGPQAMRGSAASGSMPASRTAFSTTSAPSLPSRASAESTATTTCSASTSKCRRRASRVSLRP